MRSAEDNLRRHWRAIALCMIAGVLGFFAGCGPEGPKRYDHWGTVTYQNRPIPAGMIYFDPNLDPKQQGKDGPQGYAIIKDGKYDTREKPDSGPGAGPYFIRVFAADGVEAPEAPVGKMLFQEQVQISHELPEEESELNIEIPPETR
jgi:hypothetical protein